MTTKMQHRRGTAAQWGFSDPVLADGEMGVETDTHRVKCGDGVLKWSLLPYLTLADGEVTSAKIADDTITAPKIAANAVGASELADNAVDTAAIADGAVTAAKFAVQPGNLLTANQAALSTTGLLTLTGCTEGAAGVFTSNTTGVFGARYNISSGVTPGETYTFEATIAPVGRGMHVYAQFWEAGPGALLGSFSGNTIAAGSSGRSRVTAVAPASAGYIRFYAAYGASGNSGDTVTVSSIGYWKGASGTWAMPGTPVVGQSRIAVNNAVDLSGTGTPEGVITAAPGSTWLQVGDAVTVSGNLLWRKISGTGNTGWQPEGALADTGWRTINYTLGAANWIAGDMLIRRVGKDVTARFAGVGMTTLAACYTLPSGFGIGAGRYPLAMTRENASTGNFCAFLSSGTAVPAYGYRLAGSHDPAHRYGGEMVYITDDGWPTSLPGSAV